MTGEILAWRSWHPIQGAKLQSTSHPFIWEGPVVHADRKPTKDNSNGIYAVVSKELAPPTGLWGQVALSGIVVEGMQGYRAEVATIRSLFIARHIYRPEPDGIQHNAIRYWPEANFVRALEQRYAVEVTVVEAPEPTPTYPQYGPSQQTWLAMQALQQGFANSLQQQGFPLGQLLGGVGRI